MRLVTRVSLFIYLVHHVSATLGPATDAPILTTVPSVDEYGRKCPHNFYGPTCAVPKCIKNDGRLTERYDGTYFCNCTNPYISGVHCEIYNCHGGRRIFDGNRCDCPEDFEGRFCQQSTMRNMALNTLAGIGFGIVLCYFIYETVKRRRLNRLRDKAVEDYRREREQARQREFAQLERAENVSMDEYVTGLTPVASPALIRPYEPQNLPTLVDLPPQYYAIPMPNPPPEYTP
uniref:EGF-like domain-containing protein n=1 Tax=Panagrellus redivivus TaxID=6233 RepID=A0A7E4VUA4_PANRE